MTNVNAISGYYEGPGGVFYNVTHDQIMVLEFEGKQVWRRGVGVIGKSYRVDYRGKDNVMIEAWSSDMIYLGEA